MKGRTVTQAGYELLTKLYYELKNDLDLRRKKYRYARRRIIVLRAMPTWLARRLMREGLSTKQLYLVALAKRRELRHSFLRRAAAFLLFYSVLILVLRIPAIIDRISPPQEPPQVPPEWMAVSPALLSVLLTAYACAYGVYKNARGNIGGRLAALSLDTLLLTWEFVQQPGGRSRLERFGSWGFDDLVKSRQKIQRNCWSIIYWSADITGRLRTEYTHDSISSFSRVLLWSIDKDVTLGRWSVVPETFAKLVNFIDKNHLDFDMGEVVHGGLPEMERPSIAVRIRRVFSLQRFSLVIGIGAGVATLLTYFKIILV